jgi:hypothetical protein
MRTLYTQVYFECTLKFKKLLMNLTLVRSQRLVSDDPSLKPALTKVGVHPLPSIIQWEKNSAQPCKDFLSLGSLGVPASDVPGLDLVFVERSDQVFVTVHLQLVMKALRVYAGDIV